MKTYRRMRSLAAWGFLGCVTLAITPLGCANTLESATVQQGSANSGNPLPNVTIERLQRCVVDYAPEFAWYKHSHVDAKVEVDENGLVLEVTTEGVPSSSPNLGACTRQVLRGMAVPAELMQSLRDKLEAQRPAASRSNAGGNLTGHPIVIVVAGVTLVFSDVLIQVAGISVLFAVTLELNDTVEAMRRRPRWKNDCQRQLTECLMSHVGSMWGDIHGTSRCGWCFKKCDENGWPSRVQIDDDEYVTCKYK